MKNEMKKLVAWSDIKDLIIGDNIEVASEQMDNLLDTIKKDSEDEEVVEGIDDFTADLKEKYITRAKEIDDETEEKTPEEMKRRRRAYTQLERWRVGQLYTLIQGVMNDKVITELRG